MTISGMRNEELVKTVDVACQFLVQNTRRDRQVNHQPEKNDQFQHTVQTPLSIGLPLAIHSRVRDKNLVNNLSEVYIGSDYSSADLGDCWILSAGFLQEREQHLVRY